VAVRETDEPDTQRRFHGVLPILTGFGLREHNTRSRAVAQIARPCNRKKHHASDWIRILPSGITCVGGAQSGDAERDGTMRKGTAEQ
jgi:hypothetical protein